MISGRFPRNAFILLFSLSLTAPAALARNGGNGAPKETGRTGERPVARLVGTVYTEGPSRVRERQVARVAEPCVALRGNRSESIRGNSWISISRAGGGRQS